MVVGTTLIPYVSSKVAQIPRKLTFLQCIESTREMILGSVCKRAKASCCLLNCLPQSRQRIICFNTRLPLFPYEMTDGDLHSGQTIISTGVASWISCSMSVTT